MERKFTLASFLINGRTQVFFADEFKKKVFIPKFI